MTVPLAMTTAWSQTGRVSRTWWLTTMQVSPRVWLSRRSRLMITPLAIGSSPVSGSSQSSSGGSSANARASAARRAMPPDSSRGNRLAAARRPTASSFISTSRCSTGSGRRAWARSGSATFSATLRSVSRPLPCSSTPRPLRISSSARGCRGTSWPNTSTRPSTGTSSPVIAASRVDLPVPDGPSTAVMLPCGIARSSPCRMVRPPRSRRTDDRRTAVAAGSHITLGDRKSMQRGRARARGRTGCRDLAEPG